MSASAKTRALNLIVSGAGVSVVEGNKETCMDALFEAIHVAAGITLTSWLKTGEPKALGLAQTADTLLDAYLTGENRGARLWAKWKEIKRQILNVYSPVWLSLMPGGIYPSGKDKSDLCLMFKEKMWKKLVEKETPADKIGKLKPFTKDYVPAFYEAFVKYGIPAGDRGADSLKVKAQLGPTQKKKKTGGQTYKLLPANGVYFVCCHACCILMLIMCL
jgi:hypothetical protein